MTCLAACTVWTLLVLACRFVDGKGCVPKCAAPTFAEALPDGAVIENIDSVEDGGSYGEGPRNGAYPTNPTGLPELCAVTVNVTSSAISSYRFGLFLPAPSIWKSRFLAVGNGGFAGGINWLDMAPGPHYGMATVSTDTGHNSSVTDASWALDNLEKKTDWAWRALHGSVDLGRKMTEAYYGKPIKYSYYNGCSTGGRQGLKEVQISPESFDGVLVGAPSWYVNHLNPYVTRLGIYNLPVDDPKHIPPSQFPIIAKEVMRQCDGVDGVEDGILSNPEECAFNFSKIQCGEMVSNASDCLTEEQIQTAKNVYNDYHSADGTFLYNGLLLGAEDQWNILLGGNVPSPFGTQYVQYLLLDDPDWDWKTYNDSVVSLAEKTDPGQPTAAQYDVSPFKDRGGKIVMYHGLADGLVPTLGSSLYYNRTAEAMGGGEDLDGWFRYFEVPGMQHCWSTAVGAPWNIAGAFQSTSMTTDGWSVPGFKDAEHDVLMALMDWVERGKAVDSIIATAWNSPLDASSGVLAQRPLCPHPKKAKYDGVGHVRDSSSWSC